MDATQLRAMQKPLKSRYAEDPGAANVPLKAVARLEGDGIVCQVDTWAGTTRAGLHTSTGGDGSDACSGDMLLEAIAGCAGVTLRSVATAMRVELREARVEVEGHFDARGTLGLSKEIPVGLTDVTMTFVVDTDADDKTVERLCELAERYCVVAQTLRTPPEVTVAHRRETP
ncbi:peroxiredoxin [Marmoricola endophyticus]|uniref:Peroxiredoxin n=1 Tax=Marmoricola endophyticus TaxID=2040280 RepID=A0A917B9F3_9ACTN|nr:OsmC family protein [Marmoricola endophyticus]GGF31852.1 peroxiredoxin [Marmoricola endophyticus]